MKSNARKSGFGHTRTRVSEISVVCVKLGIELLVAVLLVRPKGQPLTAICRRSAVEVIHETPTDVRHTGWRIAL